MTELMHKQLFTAALETILNQAISLDDNTQRALQTLSTQSLAVELEELSFALRFTVSDGVIVVSASNDADCLICCQLAVLSGLKDASDLTRLIKQDQLTLSGDIDVAQAFANLAKGFNIDWQAQLADRIGDVATFKLSRLGQTFVDKLKFLRDQVRQDSSEWLLHEVKAAAHKSQVNDFSQQVQAMHSAAERLERRVAALNNIKN